MAVGEGRRSAGAESTGAKSATPSRESRPRKKTLVWPRKRATISLQASVRFGQGIFSRLRHLGLQRGFAVNNQEILRCDGHDGEVSAVVFSPDGKYLLSGSFDGTVRLWNAQTGQE